MQIGAVALEELMGSEGQENVEVARRPATDSGLALAGQADAGAILDAGRNVDRQRAFAADAARTVAGGTGILDHLAAPLTAGAGALQREEALGLTNPPRSATHRAVLRLGPGLGAGARAGLTGDRNRNFDLSRPALEGLLQRDFHIVAKVRATLTATAPAALSGHSEQVFENVGE